MANTFVAIATTTVGSGGASSIDFTSIPGTYTDLVVKFSVRNTGNNAGIAFRFNSDTGANYSYKVLYGTGASALSFSQTVAAGYNTYLFAYTTPSSATASTFGNGEIYIPNYAGSTNKSSSIDSVSEDNATTAYQSMTAGLWSNTAAITSIKLLSDPGGASSNFAQYSTATLYGIKN
jgi:hypothetical protein